MAETKTEKKSASYKDSPLYIKGTPKKEVLKVKDVHRVKDFQARTDNTAKDEDKGYDGTVDEGRAQSFADKMKAGEKFPPIKVIRFTKGDGDKAEVNYAVWDGSHTHRGAELAKLPTIDCLVYDGTAEQAMYMAGMVANLEHESAGRAQSSKDKVNGVKLAAKAYINAGVPKGEWPSNRKLAEMRGVSHELVNRIDPFGRSDRDREEENKAKREAAALGKAALNGHAAANGAAPAAGVGAGVQVLDPVTKSPCNFEIKARKDGKVVAQYHAANPEKAFERFTTEHKDKTAADHMAVPIAKADKPTATPGFDWAGVDSSLSFFVRGFEAMAEKFGLAKTPEFKAAKEKLAGAAKYFLDTRKAVSKAK